MTERAELAAALCAGLRTAGTCTVPVATAQN
jgi:hypothetical protein